MSTTTASRAALPPAGADAARVGGRPGAAPDADVALAPDATPAAGETAAVRGGTDPVTAAVWRALDAVVDPELDEPVTELGFVSAVAVSEGTASIRLRLPTYFCAPNFAYLMVADAFEAARAVPGVDAVDVRLEDHFASDEINGVVAAGDGFAAAFPGQVGTAPPSNVIPEAELDALRVTFWRKAHAAEQERVASRLAGAGTDLAGARLGDAGDVARLRRRRERLGLPAGDDAPLLIDDDGSPIPAEALPLRLRLARTTRISIEGNAGLCRGLLSTRYGD